MTRWPPAYGTAAAAALEGLDATVLAVAVLPNGRIVTGGAKDRCRYRIQPLPAPGTDHWSSSWQIRPTRRGLVKSTAHA
jgi:hypothetical protein